MRSVQRRVAEIARASRAKGEKGKERIEPMYRKLLETTRRRASAQAQDETPGPTEGGA